MEYRCKQINLNHPLSFWQHFEGEERLFFYNPFTEELVIGAKRLKCFAEGESFQGYPYIFSSRTFFETVKDPKWAGFGNETLAFAYYLVEKAGRQTLYSWTGAAEVGDQDIADKARAGQDIQPGHNTCHYGPDDYGDWQILFEQVHREIAAGRVDKVVISREVKIECDHPIRVAGVIQNLGKNNQNSFIFAYSKDGRTFLGATPEILVQKERGLVISYALAGTIARNRENEREDQKQKNALLNDRKNLYEHRIVLDTIADRMKKYLGAVNIGQTKILALKNLHHLQTRIYGEDSEGAPLPEWVTRLHPTPALGGSPVAKALEIIGKYEKHERGLYASPIGLMDERGDGIFVAGIRSALIQDNVAYAYTGCGIVEKSECESEYMETSNKIKTITESL